MIKKNSKKNTMQNLGILYFSSTGNSLYISKKIKEKLGGEIKYIPNYKEDGSIFENIIIVAPIYSFGLPIPTFNLLKQLNKKSKIYVIQNYGGMVLNANALFYKYAKENNLNIKSIYTLKMPENYTLVMSPPKFFQKSILNSANQRIDKILKNIENYKFKIPKDKSKYENIYLKNKSNWHLISSYFSVTDKCTKCQHCINICPTDNITLQNGKIVFKDQCIACLSCFHRCPNKAIIYKNKDNKKRYINPYIDEKTIGKDL